jgi:hypothetical protein
MKNTGMLGITETKGSYYLYKIECLGKMQKLFYIVVLLQSKERGCGPWWLAL